MDGVTLSVRHVGATDSRLRLIWAHGWGQSGSAMLSLAESLSAVAGSDVLDFPGFGGSPAPPTTWGTAEYADHAARWLASLPPGCRIWIGHSFGCRVGLQIAARHPGLLSGMVLIAAAGLRPKRPWYQQLRFALRRNLFKLAKAALPEGPLLMKLRSKMGSADYRAAGALRPILSRVVAEDLSEQAKAVACPTLLLYGERDQDTRPEMGQRLQALIAGSRLLVLAGFDHHSILSEGRHQVLLNVKSFAEATCRSHS